MASNLSTIGFSFSDEAGFRDAMLACASKASVELACPSGHYGIWRSRTGGEIWFHLGRTETGEVEIFGLTPFFEGKSEVRMLLTEAAHRDGDNAFEGLFRGNVLTDGGGAEGSYPILFEAVDFAARTALAIPAEHHIRLAAFARELTAYADEATYYAAHDTSKGETQLAAEAFIPIGLFAAGEQAADAAAVPGSMALLTGKVLEVSPLTNEASGLGFVWALVQTLDATLDVIADPAVVAGEIVEGGIIECSALMFGRLLD